MSLYSAILSARKNKEEPAAPAAPAPEIEVEDDPDALPVFELVPPERDEAEPVEQEPEEAEAEEAEPLRLVEPHRIEPHHVEPPLALPEGRNVHTIGIHDLTRLAIDNDGRLYWDGKPVEVSRRIMMSRKQILAASLVALFVVIGALGAAIQGAAAARDWACRLGWTTSTCGAPPHDSSKIPT